MASVCLSEKFKGKPDAGNLHVRFDEGEGYSLPTLLSHLRSNADQKHSKYNRIKLVIYLIMDVSYFTDFY